VSLRGIWFVSYFPPPPPRLEEAPLPTSVKRASFSLFFFSPLSKLKKRSEMRHFSFFSFFPFAQEFFPSQMRERLSFFFFSLLLHGKLRSSFFSFLFSVFFIEGFPFLFPSPPHPGKGREAMIPRFLLSPPLPGSWCPLPFAQREGCLILFFPPSSFEERISGIEIDSFFFPPSFHR